MKLNIVSIVFFCSAVASADVVSNEYLTVDQHGNLSQSNAVASIHAVADAAAQAEVASSKAQAAATAASLATNTLSGIVQDISDRDLVIYQRGYTTAFDKTVFLSPDAQLFMSGITPNVGLSQDGTMVSTRIDYACTESAADVVPIVKYSDSFSDPSEDWTSISFDGPTAGSPYTDPGTGQVYGYGYTLTAWSPVTDSGFYRLVINPDDVVGPSYVFDISGGITGGATKTVDWDGLSIRIVGGLVTSVTEL